MAESVHLLFLTSKSFEQGKAIRGASLATDEKTRPIEFRCTSPIRPNNYQRTLYGDTLDAYIFVDLIGVPLITATREDIDLVLVDDERLLAVRPTVDVPIVLLTRSPSGQAGPGAVALKVCPGFENEKSTAQTRLSSLVSQGTDLLEPFERVRLALDQAHAQKIGDKSA